MRIASESMAPTLRSGDHVLVDKLHYRGTDDVERGDTVAIEDGRLAVNGRPRVEPYADQRAIDSVYFGPVKVQPGTVFVLGDDRANSIDSRSFGGVPTRDVVGRVVARVWPPQRWGTPR